MSFSRICAPLREAKSRPRRTFPIEFWSDPWDLPPGGMCILAFGGVLSVTGYCRLCRCTVVSLPIHRRYPEDMLGNYRMVGEVYAGGWLRVVV